MTYEEARALQEEIRQSVWGKDHRILLTCPHEGPGYVVHMKAKRLGLEVTFASVSAWRTFSGEE